MKLLRFFISRVFWVNIGVAALLGGVLLFVVVKMLGVYTNIGEEVDLPVFVSKTKGEAITLAQKTDVKLFVSDTIYKEGVSVGSILSQYPRSGERVKKGRKVFVTIAGGEPDNVKLPRLKDISLREATVMLEHLGLRLGEVEYKASQFHGLVLDQSIDGSECSPGDNVPKGTIINLVVGADEVMEKVNLPDLIGASVKSAIGRIEQLGLTSGAILYDEKIESKEDSLNAIVVKQKPYGERLISEGDLIDIWLDLPKSIDLEIDE